MTNTVHKENGSFTKMGFMDEVGIKPCKFISEKVGYTFDEKCEMTYMAVEYDYFKECEKQCPPLFMPIEWASDVSTLAEMLSIDEYVVSMLLNKGIPYVGGRVTEVFPRGILFISVVNNDEEF